MADPVAEMTLGRFVRSLQPAWKKPEQWLEWPPDTFALTTLIFEATGAYRYTVSPPERRELPIHQPSWEAYLVERVKEWHGWLNDCERPLPKRLGAIARLLWRPEARRLPLSQLRKIPSGEAGVLAWQVFLALLELHCQSDSASPGYGLPTSSAADSSPRHFLANMLLTSRGTLSRLPPSQVIVLPKMRTPRVGITLRSLSHHLTAHRTEVEVIWRSTPWISRDENVLNMLVLPWPYRLKPGSFSPVSLAESLGARGGRYFRYNGPDEKFDAADVVRLLRQAQRHVKRVHLVVLPELALTLQELKELKEVLARNFADKKVPLVLAGERLETVGEGELGWNRVVLSTFFAGKWYDLFQDKHHRWKLESGQLRQYGLKGHFPGVDEWWEAIRVPARQLTFLSPTDWLTLCPLICEDLARLDPVSPLIRGVGPSLLVAVLLDGPQIKSRWSARYASVLAEDPGTSVLTVSSLGMSLQGSEAEPTQRHTVAMWKDLWGPWKELALHQDEHAVLLSVRAEMEEEVTLDGRSDHGYAAVFRYQQHWALRLPETHEHEDEIKRADYLPPSPVDLEELTRFCHLVDDALALGGDDDALECLFRLAVDRDGEAAKHPWIAGCRFASGLATLIAAELADLYENQEAGYQEFRSYLDYFKGWIDGARRGVDFARQRLPIEFLERLVLLARGALLADTESLPEDLLEVLVLPGERDKKRLRMQVLVSLAVIWAIHRRIVPQPKQPSTDRRPGELAQEERKLIREIESLLAHDYQLTHFVLEAPGSG